MNELLILISGTFAGLALGILGMILIESEEHKIIYIKAPELESFMKNPTIRVKNVKVKKKPLLPKQEVTFGLPVETNDGNWHYEPSCSEVYTKAKHKEWEAHTEGKI